MLLTVNENVSQALTKPLGPKTKAALRLLLFSGLKTELLQAESGNLIVEGTR
ncbi:MAG: hypothetical protein K0Q78_96 [Cellvibrio sp.]|jgi:hypothetical protein|nr:hypothetical protein [Cellvibrio sp.]